MPLPCWARCRDIRVLALAALGARLRGLGRLLRPSWGPFSAALRLSCFWGWTREKPPLSVEPARADGAWPPCCEPGAMRLQ